MAAHSTLRYSTSHSTLFYSTSPCLTPHHGVSQQAHNAGTLHVMLCVTKHHTVLCLTKYQIMLCYTKHNIVLCLTEHDTELCFTEHYVVFCLTESRLLSSSAFSYDTAHSTLPNSTPHYCVYIVWNSSTVQNVQYPTLL